MCVQVGIDLYILHRRYQVKSHTFLWFPAGSATAIAHMFFSFGQVNSVNPLCLKAKFRSTRNLCKRILENIKLTYVNETKESITSQKLCSRDCL